MGFNSAFKGLTTICEVMLDTEGNVTQKEKKKKKIGDMLSCLKILQQLQWTSSVYVVNNTTHFLLNVIF